MSRYEFLFALVLGLSTVPAKAFAQTEEATPSPWSHESEVSVVNVDGNTRGEISSLKQKTEYKIEANSFALTGRWIRVKTNDVETARAWDAAARYERTLSELWSAFIGHGAESDEYSGYIQRDNSDVGAKYFIEKSDLINFFVESGYRYTKTYSVGGTVTHSNGLRFYTEYSHKPTTSVSYKIWVEYLPNFNDSEAYLVNAEPSVNVMLSQIFSLKTSYLVKYKNQLAVPGEKRADTTFTTSLVAKF